PQRRPAADRRGGGRPDGHRGRDGRGPRGGPARGVGRPQQPLPPVHQPAVRDADAERDDGAGDGPLGPPAPVLLRRRARPPHRAGPGGAPGAARGHARARPRRPREGGQAAQPGRAAGLRRVPPGAGRVASVPSRRMALPPAAAPASSVSSAPSPPALPERQRVLAVVTAFLALFSVVGCALYGLPFFYDFFVRDLGWTRQQVTSGNALSKLVVGPVFGFLAGMMVDAVGPRRVMIVGILIA